MATGKSFKQQRNAQVRANINSVKKSLDNQYKTVIDNGNKINQKLQQDLVEIINKGNELKELIEKYREKNESPLALKLMTNFLKEYDTIK